ncbi:MAG: hypothetical protein GF355_03405, partial [Candidatus Eisenbacteria bacterium]|nr:hypothetical protein [Candidatus Eisenbacteria bacterium]
METSLPHAARAPWPRSLAIHPGYDAVMRRWLAAALPRIVELAAAHGPRAIYLSGSAAWGEMAAVEREGCWLPLSDVDLALVLDRRPPGLAARLQSALEAERTRSGAGRRLRASPIKIGTYAKHHLGLQPPTLGVAEMRAAGVCLWGEEQWLQRFPDPAREGLGRWELLRLLFNRALETVEALAVADREDGDGAGRGARAASAAGGASAAARLQADYAVAKLGCELGTLWLARRGRLIWGARRRV